VQYRVRVGYKNSKSVEVYQTISTTAPTASFDAIVNGVARSRAISEIYLLNCSCSICRISVCLVSTALSEPTGRWWWVLQAWSELTYSRNRTSGFWLLTLGLVCVYAETSRTCLQNQIDIKMLENGAEEFAHFRGARTCNKMNRECRNSLSCSYLRRAWLQTSEAHSWSWGNQQKSKACYENFSRWRKQESDFTMLEYWYIDALKDLRYTLIKLLAPVDIEKFRAVAQSGDRRFSNWLLSAWIMISKYIHIF